MSELVAVAKVLKPRGIKGEVACEILTDFPERFDGLENVIAVQSNGDRRELKIEEYWFQQSRLVIKFTGVESIEDAETLRDAEICVNEENAVELAEGEFFDWQLEGCQVKTTDGSVVGIVKGLLRNGATEILMVEGAKEYLIPFAESICIRVDIERKIIDIDPPEGLLDF